MAAWRYKISVLVLKKYFSLEEKFRISARSCNILYILIMQKHAVNLCTELGLTVAKLSSRHDW